VSFMPKEFWIIVAAGAVVAVLLALIFGRNFIIKWKNLLVKTGEAKTGVIQTARATGEGSSVKKVKQQSNTGAGKQDAVAEQGGTVADVSQKQGKQR
jgi:hypothetical protein